MRDQPTAWDTAYEWKAVTLLTLGFGLVGLDRWIIAPLFPAMMKDLNLNYQDLGNIIAVLGVAWGIFAILTGALSDKIGRRRVLVPAIIGFSLLSGLSGAATGLVSLLLIRVVMGVTEGAFCPTSFAATNDASLPARRGRNQGIQQCAFALFGLGLGPIVATQLLAVVPDWRWVFLLVGIPGLVLAVLMWVIIRDPVNSQGGSGHGQVSAEIAADGGSASLFGHRNVLLGMLGLLCAMTGIFVLGAMIPSYLTDYLKLEPAQMGFVTSALGFGGALGQFGLPTVSDFWGRRPVAIAGFVAGTLFLLAFSRTGPEPVTLFALLFMAAVFAFGLLALITGPIAVEAAPAGRTAAAVGVIIGAGEIFGGGVAPAIAGWLANLYGIQSALTLALGGLLTGIVISLFLRETAPRRIASLALEPKRAV